MFLQLWSSWLLLFSLLHFALQDVNLITFNQFLCSLIFYFPLSNHFTSVAFIFWICWKRRLAYNQSCTHLPHYSKCLSFYNLISVDSFHYSQVSHQPGALAHFCLKALNCRLICTSVLRYFWNVKYKAMPPLLKMTDSINLLIQKEGKRKTKQLSFWCMTNRTFDVHIKASNVWVRWSSQTVHIKLPFCFQT